MNKYGMRDKGCITSLSGISHTIFFIFLATAIVSCYHGKSGGIHTLTIPEWVNSPPIDERYYYAVGRSGPLIPENDAWEQAKERGRAEIGRYIVSHIKSSFTSIQSTGGDL